MKMIKFKKGINTIRIPFLLDPDTPWQEQVKKEMEKFNKNYKYSKKASLGFCINESLFAELILTKE